MKKLTLVLLFVLFIGGVSAQQPLENFEEIDGFGSFTPGQVQEIKASFDSTSKGELPLYIRLNATSDKEMAGEEFSLSARLNSSNSSNYRVSELRCGALKGEQYIYGENSMIYSCFGDGSEIIPQSDNNLTVDVKSNAALAPADYSFELEVLTRIGHASEKKTVPASKTADISFKNTALSVESEQKIDTTAWRYSRLFVEEPGDKKYIRGINVVASPSYVENRVCLPYLGDQVNIIDDYVKDNGYWFDRVRCSKPSSSISGEVEFSYSNRADENTVGIYRFDVDKGGWDELEVSIDTSENRVAANLTGDSTYAAFTKFKPKNNPSEPESLGGTGGDSGFSTASIDIADTDSGQETEEDSVDNSAETEDENKLRPRPEFEIVIPEDNTREDVVLNASGSYDPDGRIETYEWSFGKNGRVVTHSFPEGEIDITLTVFDDDGLNASVTRSLNSAESAIESPSDDNTNPTAPATGAFTQVETGHVLLTLLSMIMAGIYYIQRKNGFEKILSRF